MTNEFDDPVIHICYFRELSRIAPNALLLLVFKTLLSCFLYNVRVNKGLDKSTTKRLTYVSKTKHLILLPEEKAVKITGILYEQGDFQ